MADPPPARLGNLFEDLPAASSVEDFETLLERPGVRLLRIVSHGQSTPPGEWYDQDEDEWVMVLRGAAGLRIEGEDAVRELGPGAYAHLPAHCRHRVEWTHADEPTVWLALHMPFPGD